MTGRTRRKRELGSLALSIGIHSGVLLAGSLVWVATRAPAAPPAVEVAFLKMPPPPAPVEGQPLAGQAAEDTPEERAPAERARKKLQAAAQRQPATGPSVQATVTVAKAGYDPADRAAPSEPAIIARWQPAAELAIDRSRHEHRHDGRAQRKPALRGRTYSLAGFGPAREAARSQRWSREDPTPGPQVDPDALPFHVHDHGAGVIERLLPALPKPPQAGGDRRSLIENIQARIDRIAPLVHRTSQDCRNASGLARIRFIMDTRGYPIGYQILSSAGNPCLDTQIDTVLHLAEPYPFVAGWVPVKVKFTL